MKPTHRKNLESMLKSNSVSEIILEMAVIIEGKGYAVLPLRLRQFVASDFQTADINPFDKEEEQV